MGKWGRPTVLLPRPPPTCVRRARASANPQLRHARAAPPEVWRALPLEPSGLARCRRAPEDPHCEEPAVVPLREDLVKIVRGPVLALTGTLVENKPPDLWIVCVRPQDRARDLPGGISEFAEHFLAASTTSPPALTFPVTPPGGSIHCASPTRGTSSCGRSKRSRATSQRPTRQRFARPPAGSSTSPETSRTRSESTMRARAWRSPTSKRAPRRKVSSAISRLRKESAIAKIPTMLARLDVLVDEEPIVVLRSTSIRSRRSRSARVGRDHGRRNAAPPTTDHRRLPGGRVPRDRDHLRRCARAHHTRANYFLRVSFSWLDAWGARARGDGDFLPRAPVTIEVLIAEHAIERRCFADSAKVANATPDLGETRGPVNRPRYLSFTGSATTATAPPTVSSATARACAPDRRLDAGRHAHARGRRGRVPCSRSGRASPLLGETSIEGAIRAACAEPWGPDKDTTIEEDAETAIGDAPCARWTRSPLGALRARRARGPRVHRAALRDPDRRSRARRLLHRGFVAKIDLALRDHEYDGRLALIDLKVSKYLDTDLGLDPQLALYQHVMGAVGLWPELAWQYRISPAAPSPLSPSPSRSGSAPQHQT